MSKTTWILFGLASICYAFAWTEVAAGLGAFGIVFELFMYVSMFADHNEQKKLKSKNMEDGNDDTRKHT